MEDVFKRYRCDLIDNAFLGDIRNIAWWFAVYALIENNKFDFIGAISDIEQYGYKNAVPVKTVHRIQSVFEELCQQILIPTLDVLKILFTVEYADNKAMITVMYNGERFDVRETDNSLSFKIIESTAENIEFEETDDEIYKNKLSLCLKQ